jgi:antitoxin component HigA of HigAB toxin-antitoxin module
MNTGQLTYNTEAEYEAAMDEIYELMNRGEANLSEGEKDKVQAMAVAAEAYEDEYFPFPPPETIPEMVERKC